MEAAKAMAMIHSQSQPHLTLRTYNDPGNDDGSSSSGELLRGGGGTANASSGGGRSSSSSLRRRASYGDVAILRTRDAAGGAPLSSKPPPRHGSGRGEHAADANIRVWTPDEQAAESYHYISATPGYVSFEDVMGAAALYRDGSGRPLEATIRDPLMRAASRLQAPKDGGRRSQHRRQRSPGPLGTRRGSAMHWVVKKYVRPLQGFLADVFCCFGRDRRRRRRRLEPTV